MHTATMTQRFGVPALVAATFHVVLLLGFNTPIIPTVALRPPKIEDIICVLPIKEDIVVPPQDDGEKVPEVRALASGPEMPETPDRSSRTAAISIPVIAPSVAPAADVKLDRIPKNWKPAGQGGTEIGISGRLIFSPDQLDAHPRTKVQVSPEYPFALRSAGIEGNATIEFDVDATGRVVSARAMSSTHREFEEAAVRAVLKWRFEPGKRHGKPVPFRMVVPIGFTMTGE